MTSQHCLKGSSMNNAKFNLKSKFVIVPVVILAIIILLTAPVLVFVAKANKAYKQILPIVENLNIKDTNKIKNDLTLVKTTVSELQTSYKLFSWMKIFPGLGKYIDDLGHSIKAGIYVIDATEITLTTVEPYLSVLGFSDSGKDNTQTSQERIDFVINSIPEILPKAGEISEKFKKAEEELHKLSKKEKTAIINALLRKASKEIEISTIYCNSSDKGFVRTSTEIIADENITAGIIVENKDKTIRIDYSLENTMQQLREQKLQEIAYTLFE